MTLVIALTACNRTEETHLQEKTKAPQQEVIVKSNNELNALKEVEKTILEDATKRENLARTEAEEKARNLFSVLEQEKPVGKEVLSKMVDSMYIGNFIYSSIFQILREETVNRHATEEQKVEEVLIAKFWSWVLHNQVPAKKMFTDTIPTLRTNKKLISALREQKSILEIVYTEEKFTKLVACSDSLSQNIPPPVTCQKAAAEVGLHYDQNTGLARNTVWLVKFLQRRNAQGGEQFAQFCQGLVLSLVKE